jgi:hypothetical protein
LPVEESTVWIYNRAMVTFLQPLSGAVSLRSTI